MLVELTVRNFGIIESITWQPAAGLNIITGETGAGKSLVVDAVDALLSGQANEEDIRHGADAAQVEGVFSHSAASTLTEFLGEKGLENDGDTLLLSCDFRRQGRTVPRVNRQAVSRSLLRNIGDMLVDIHGQSEHLSLLRTDHHLDFLDAWARTLDLRRDVAGNVAELHNLERELASLARDDHDLARRRDLLTFQVEEISRAELQDDEEETLRQELAVLSSAEKLKEHATGVYRALYGNDSAAAGASAIDCLNEALPLLRDIVETDTSLQPRLSALEDALLNLEELARDVRSYGDNLAYDPARMEEVQGRLELIRGLKRKYGDSIPAILAFAATAAGELEGLTDAGERRERLAAQIDELKKGLGALAERLSRQRQAAAGKLAAAVQDELNDLGMGRVVFSVDVAQSPDEDGIPFGNGGRYAFSGTGADDVVFLAATNPGEPLKPLEKIASTGEISRFLLALKSALAAADTVPVLIFDEIDIGVGGRSGEVIGKKLWKLSRHHQVICVTHLPQIAAFADAHFTVAKQAAGERTVSTIRPLQHEERAGELAAMIAGPQPTSTAMTAAAELIEKATAWKSA